MLAERFRQAIGPLVACLAVAPWAAAQNNFVAGFGNQAGNNVFLPGGQQNLQGNGQQRPAGNGFPGGAANADFDSLVELISSTIEPDSWVANGGPEADIRPFPGGVWVDSHGLLREFEARSEVQLTSLENPPPPAMPHSANPRSAAELRCVSLPRLEAAIYHRMAEGDSLDESMLTLAGLQRVQFVFVYPNLGDVVLAGPAGDWRLDAERRLVSTSDGTPVVRLDDLLTLLRRERDKHQSPLGCSITPRQQNLAATQDFAQRSSAKPLKPGKRAREKWLEEIRSTLGRQDIEVFGLDPGTHAAHVLVKADHHMKRIGIGLESGVVGVESYLETVARDDTQQALSVLRWWFSAKYDGVARNAGGTAYQLMGQGVEVLSENELLTKRGERVHTGQAEDATQTFAHQFTTQFAALAVKYPVYGELRNLFDLAIVAALIESRDLYGTAGWQPVLLLDAEHLKLPVYTAAKEVDTIINHRLKGEREILAAVSGGVWMDNRAVLAKIPADSGNADYYREQPPKNLPAGTWWWDLR